MDHFYLDFYVSDTEDSPTHPQKRPRVEESMDIDDQSNVSYQRPRLKSYLNFLDPYAEDDAKNQDSGNKIDFSLTIETCAAMGLSPWAIVKILNSCIMDARLDEDMLVSRTTMRRKIDEMNKSKMSTHEGKSKGLIYLGHDGRQDVTMMPKGRFEKEDHLVYVDEKGDYITHSSFAKNEPSKAKDVAKKVNKVIDDTESNETLTYVASDGEIKNTGHNGGINRLIEIHLKRPLTMVMCVLHAGERPMSALFKRYDGQSTCPGFNGGPIGKAMTNFQKNGYKPIVNFKKVKGLVKDYSDDPGFIASLNNDLQYLYELCMALQKGPQFFSEALANKIPGQMHQARWVTLASNEGRLYAQTENPTQNLTNGVKYVLNVYAPSIFEIKKHPHISQGTVHLYNIIKRGRDLLFHKEDKGEWNTFKASILHNCWMAHVEMLIIALIHDDRKAKRSKGIRLIREARQTVSDKMRAIEKPTEEMINFIAEDYSEILNLKKLDRITEPPCTFKFNDQQLDEIVEGTRKPDLGNIYCHSSHVERAVAAVTKAAEKRIGFENRHAYILTKMDSTKKFAKNMTKAEAKALYRQVEDSEDPEAIFE